MKKIFVLMALVLICTTGCSLREKIIENWDGREKMVCTLKESMDDYDYNIKYIVKYKGEFVDEIETEAEYITDNSKLLDSIEESIIESYEEFNSEYGGYTYTMNKNSGKLSVNTIVDYNTMNVKKYAEKYEDARKNFNEDYKVILEKMKEFYTSLGAVCE